MSEAGRASQQPLLDVRGLQKFFPIRKGFWKRTVGQVRAVNGVSFALQEGETLGLVGESGCGKTTTARCILRAIEPTAGQVVDVATIPKAELRTLRREMQMVFQDPCTSLNPRMTLLDPVSMRARAWTGYQHTFAQILNQRMKESGMQLPVHDYLDAVGISYSTG